MSEIRRLDGSSGLSGLRSPGQHSQRLIAFPAAQKIRRPKGVLQGRSHPRQDRSHGFVAVSRLKHLQPFRLNQKSCERHTVRGTQAKPLPHIGGQESLIG